MKKLLLMIPALFLLLSCSGSTDPEDSNDPPDDGFELVAELEIGPAGGTLAGEGFEMVVPAGAFDATVTLELAVATEERDREGSIVTSLYRVEGLPGEVYENLEIAMDYEGDLTWLSFIEEGRYVYGETEPGELQMHRAPLPTGSSGGRLVAETLDGDRRSEAPGRSDAYEVIRFFLGVTNRATSSSQYFDFNYDKSVEDEVALLSLLLEAELAVIMEDWDLRFGADEYVFPISVNLMDPYHHVGQSVDSWPLSGRTEFDRQGRAGSSISMIESWIDPEIHDRLPECAGAMLLGFHQAMCEGSWIAYSTPTQLLIHRGFQEWARGEFTIDPAYVGPPGLVGQEDRIFDGLVACIGDDTSMPHAIRRGPALAPFARHFESHAGMGCYKQAYQYVRDGMPVLDALLACQDYDLRDYADCIMLYLVSEPYGVSWRTLTDDPEAIWTLEPGESHSLNFGNPVSFLDLSTRVIALPLLSQYQGTASLQVKAESPDAAPEELFIWLLGDKNGDLYFQNEGGGDVTLDDLQNLPGEGYTSLYAVIVNLNHDADYLGSSQVTVDMSVDQALSFNALSLTLAFDARVQEGVNLVHYPYYVLQLPTGPGPFAAGEFDLPVEWIDDYGGGDYIEYLGNYTGTISEDGMTLHSLVVDITRNYFVDGVQAGNGILDLRIEGPMTTDSMGSFGVNGTATCDYLDEVDVHTWYGENQSYITTWQCNEDSYINVQFY